MEPRGLEPRFLDGPRPARLSTLTEIDSPRAPAPPPRTTVAPGIEAVLVAQDPVRFILQRRELTDGNRIQILRDGGRAYPRMLAAIASAERSIIMEMYTFADDFIGRQFARALAFRAEAGVEVRVLYDSVGSRSTPREFFGWMRSRGIRVQAFHPLHPFPLVLGHRSRNHRKVLVIDGRVAFLGGLNLAKEYAPIDQGGGGWRDTELEIEGPASEYLARLSLDYGSSDGERLRQTTIRRSLRGTRVDPGSPLLILGSPKLSDRRAISRHLRFAFRQASRRIWIANPYFLPSRPLRGELRRAARRGVDVRLLVPRSSDVPAFQFASERLFDRYLRWGLRIFQWQGPMMHAKAAVIDGLWATVGSYNLDALSLSLNDELVAIVPDRDFGRRLEGMFEEDFRGSSELTLRDWRNRGQLRRLAEKFFYLFRIIL
jgi:cardiolipin synthase